MPTDWMPGVIKKPITSKIRSRGSSKANAFVMHIAVSESVSLHTLFSNSKYGCSHFYVRRSGLIEQYLPISSKSMADVYGNHRAVSAETQGGFKQEPWTDAQVNALAQIAAFLHDEWDIPLKLMTDSRPTTSGVGYHRLGINGNFPNDSLFAGRKQRGGGEVWSTSFGKTCPDNKAFPANETSRIAQVPGIIIDAMHMVTQKPKPPEPDPVPPPPTPELEYNMDKLDLRNADKVTVTGRHVNNLQGLLLAAQFGPDGLVGSNGKPDGRAGVKTKYWFGKFQERYPATGTNGNKDYICGDTSWKYLIEK